jgi:hypothetical protein
LLVDAYHDADRSLTGVAIAPAFGDRYLDPVYDDRWVADNVGAETLVAGALRHSSVTLPRNRGKSAPR